MLAILISILIRLRLLLTCVPFRYYRKKFDMIPSLRIKRVWKTEYG